MAPETTPATPLAAAEALELLAAEGPDLLTVHDSYGNYRYASPNVARVLGRAPEELVGSNAYDYFHPDDLEAIMASHEGTLYHGEETTVQYRLRRPDGSYVWVETTTRTVQRDGDRGTILAVTRPLGDRAPDVARLL